MTDARIAMTTVASEQEAAKIAHALVEEHLAACVQILPPMQSVYRWQGAVRNDREWLILIKTTAARLAHLERRITELHAYAVPEFLVLEVTAATPHYLAWLASETALLS
jgi:periplasmic divalent cation tolerance protein